MSTSNFESPSDVRRQVLGSDAPYVVETLRGIFSNREPQGQAFINGCFNWMIPNLYIENGYVSENEFIQFLSVFFMPF